MEAIAETDTEIKVQRYDVKREGLLIHSFAGIETREGMLAVDTAAAQIFFEKDGLIRTADFDDYVREIERRVDGEGITEEMREQIRTRLATLEKEYFERRDRTFNQDDAEKLRNEIMKDERPEARELETPVAEEASAYEGHALIRPSDAEAVAILDDLKVPALVYVSYADLMNTFTLEQRANLFAIAEQYHEKVRLTIYAADATDERLKPFRELQNRHQNVRIIGEQAQVAFDRTQTDFVSGYEGYVNIHLSKADFDVKTSYDDAARGEIYFFRYQLDEIETGLLAAALLWKDYLEADKWLEGIERDADGFLIVTGEYLRALIQRYEANLVVLMSA
jgi:hypothetical protein